MSIIKQIGDWLSDFFDDTPKQKENKVTNEIKATDSINNYPNTPRLNGSLRELLPTIGSRSGLIIPATELTIEDESLSAFQNRQKKETSEKYKYLASDDFFTFSSERRKMIANGFLYVSAERIKFDLIELTECIQDRGRGDEDGFGVEPDTFVKGYLNIDGGFVSPIALEDSNTITNIKNWLLMDINPIDAMGNVKIFPYDEVEKTYRLPGYFVVCKDTNFGIIDKELNLVIPTMYKMLHGEENGLVWVRVHNNLCGIVDLQNDTKIPAVYNYLSYIETGKYKSLYVAELNGKHGLINQDNVIAMPFEEIDLKSFYELIKYY